MKKIILSIVLISLLLLGYIWFFVYNKAHKNIISEKVDFTTSATQIASEFIDTPEESAKKYNEKVVVLQGNVKEIILDDSTSSIVFEGNENYVIICELLPNENSLATSTKIGQSLALKGFFIGSIAPDPDFGLPGDIRLKKCTLNK